VDEFFSSVKAYLFDRMSSPFVGAYFFSWLAFNIKLVMVLFSGLDTYDKLDFIDWYFRFDLLVYCHIWVYPLVASLLYVFVLPYPSRFVLSYTLKQNYKNLLIRQKIENETPLTKVLAAQLRKELKELRDAAGNKDGEIDNLRQELRAANEKGEALLEAKGQIESLLEKERVTQGLINELSENIKNLTPKANGYEESQRALRDANREIKSYEERYGGADYLDKILKIIAESNASNHYIEHTISEYRKKQRKPRALAKDNSAILSSKVDPSAPQSE